MDGTGRMGDVDAGLAKAISRSWLDQPRLATALRAVETSPTARSVLASAADRPTFVRFERAPKTIQQFERRQANPIGASYRPGTNTMQFGAGFGVDAPFSVVGRDGSPVLVDFGDSAARDGIYLVHESAHRVQNRRAAMLADALFVQPVMAPLRGVREFLHAAPDESRRTAFMRGVDRSLMRYEIDAYRIDDRVSFELGRPAHYHDATGSYLGDDVVLADNIALYRRNLHASWAMSSMLGVLVAGAGAAQLLEARPSAG